MVKTPIVIEINTADFNKTSAIQQGLQLLVNSLDIDTCVSVANTIRQNPHGISSKIASLSTNKIMRKLIGIK